MGWVPADFGAATFDAILLHGIELFQARRVLPVTGVADYRTYQALLSYREALRSSARDRERRANLSGLGSVSRWSSDDPRAVKSDPFTGTIVVASGGVNTLLGRAARAGRVRVAICTMDAPGFLRAASALTDAGVRVVAAGRALQGLLRGLRSNSLRQHLAGVAVRHRAVSDLSVEADARWVCDAVARLRDVVPDLPVAVVLPPHKAPRTMSVRARRAMDLLRGIADVYLPQVPGSRRGSAPEWWCGQLFAECSILLGEGAAKWTFPLYEPAPGDRNHVLRFRAWMKARGIRGHGYTRMPHDVGNGPFLGPLPDRIKRVDNAIAWPRAR